MSNEARGLLLSQRFGVLSTHSEDMPGYPFGSVTPFTLDGRGEIIILIARLAQHYKNIDANPKVSLVVLEKGHADIQEGARLTYLANATPVGMNEDAAARYVRYFHEAEHYAAELGFEYYRLELVRARFIGGFGKVAWVEPSDMLSRNLFQEAEEKEILGHMNQDHQAALCHYMRHFVGMRLEDDDQPKMVGIDAHGFDLKLRGVFFRIPFEEPVTSAQTVRDRLIRMAHM